MKSDSYSFLICIPFTLGVAAAGLIPSERVSATLQSMVALTGSILCLVHLLGRKGKDRALIAALFLFCGYFCAAVQGADQYYAGKAAGEGLAGTLVGLLRQRLDTLPFDDPHTAALLKALMSGDKGSLGRDCVELFRVCGASHLLALSGLHLGIVASFVRAILLCLGNSKVSGVIRSVVLIVFCTLYCIGCGASPSLVRALIYICFAQAAELMRHRRSSLRSRLCWACTLQLAMSPGVISTAAFQLSYLAMAGISFIAPTLEGWYPSNRISRRFDPVRKVWVALSVSLSCQITTAPLVYFLFGSFPQYFFLVNLLAMPLCEVLIPLGIAALIPGMPALVYEGCDLLCGLLLGCLEIISQM